MAHLHSTRDAPQATAVLVLLVILNAANCLAQSSVVTVSASTNFEDFFFIMTSSELLPLSTLSSVLHPPSTSTTSLPSPSLTASSGAVFMRTPPPTPLSSSHPSFPSSSLSSFPVPTPTDTLPNHMYISTSTATTQRIPHSPSLTLSSLSGPVTSSSSSFTRTSVSYTTAPPPLSSTSSLPGSSSSSSLSTPPQSSIHRPSPSTAPPTPSGSAESVISEIINFLQDNASSTVFIAVVVLVPIILLLFILVAILGCCCCCKAWKARRKAYNIANLSVNGSSYRPRSQASLQAYELKTMDEDNRSFYGDFSPSGSHSQPHPNQITAEPSYLNSLPSISPFSYPSQLRNYMNLSEPQEDRAHPASSPSPGMLSSSRASSARAGVSHELRRFPGSSPSLHHPTPLGQQLQKQAEKASTYGSRNSIQGSRASINALGSKGSFSGSYFSSNTVSREEMRASSSILGGPVPCGDSNLSLKDDEPILHQGSLDVVPTRESPVPPFAGRVARKEFVSLTCISNPHAVGLNTQLREDSDREEQIDLQPEPLITSTPSGPLVHGVPTKGERGRQESAADISLLSSPQRRAQVNLQQLTSLSPKQAMTSSWTQAGGMEEEEVKSNETKLRTKSTLTHKDAKRASPRGLSRLEKLTSLNYIRSSIRRSLKKKRVSFLTNKSPETTPQLSKKSPPPSEPSLTFSNPSTFEREQPRIRTPSPLSPTSDATDNHFQRDFPDDSLPPDIYPESLPLHSHTPYGIPLSHRPRAYSDMPHYIPQLSQPTYYPSSTPAHPLASYPQLSQQYPQQPYAYPQVVGSSGHRSLMAPHAPHSHSIYSRRLSDITRPGAGSRPVEPGVGGTYRPLPLQSLHHHDRPAYELSRHARIRSPEAALESSGRYGQQPHSPTQLTETSNISDLQAPSPDMYTLLQEQEAFDDSLQQFRESPVQMDDYIMHNLYSLPPSSSSYGQHMEGGQYREMAAEEVDPRPSRDRVESRPHQSGASGRYSGRADLDDYRMDLHGVEPHTLDHRGMESGWHPQQVPRNRGYLVEGKGVYASGVAGEGQVERMVTTPTNNMHHHAGFGAGQSGSHDDDGSGDCTPRARVSWNNEIIEYVRTPSECSSDHYDL